MGTIAKIASSVALLSGAIASASATAAQVSFDFAPNALTLQQVSQTDFTTGGVNAYGAVSYNGGKDWEVVELWGRDDSGERGMGVCSQGDDVNGACTPNADGTLKSGGGDYNELEDAGSIEGIVLSLLDPSRMWTTLYISSLDANDLPNDVVEGRLYYGDDGNWVDSFAFKYGDFGTKVEGDLLSIMDAETRAAVASSNSVAFRAEGAGGNDYLVWKGSHDVVVPLPGTFGLLGIGLAGLGLIRRKKV